MTRTRLRAPRDLREHTRQAAHVLVAQQMGEQVADSLDWIIRGRLATATIDHHGTCLRYDPGDLFAEMFPPQLVLCDACPVCFAERERSVRTLAELGDAMYDSQFACETCSSARTAA